MLLLVRSKGVAEVVSAVAAYAEDDGGLEPFEVDPENPLSLAAALSGRSAVVSESDGWAIVTNVASLDIADADEWGAALSASCEATVVAIEAVEEGAHVFVFDGGEPNVDLELPIGKAQPAPELAELASDPNGRAVLQRGISARTHDELVAAIGRALGMAESPSASTMIGFDDPLDEEDESGPEGLVVEGLLPTAQRLARVGEYLETFGAPFGVRLASGEPVRGLVLEISGDALSLLEVEELVVAIRREGAFERVQGTIPVEPNGDVFLASLPDAYLEAIAPASLGLDMGDMFGSLQQMMRSGEDQTLNTVSVGIAARGKLVGEGLLCLRARTTDGTFVSEVASVAVAVTPR